MSNRFMLVIACLIMSAYFCIAAPLPDKDGFGGIKWGTPYSIDLGMQCKDYGTHLTCIKENEDLKVLGSVPVVVEYVFSGG